MARHLDVKICGVETCYLGVMNPDVDLGSKMSLSLTWGET